MHSGNSKKRKNLEVTVNLKDFDLNPTEIARLKEEYEFEKDEALEEMLNTCRIQKGNPLREFESLITLFTEAQKIYKYIIEYPKDKTPLDWHDVVSHGPVGSQVEESRLLLVAAILGKTEMLKCFLELGARIDNRREYTLDDKNQDCSCLEVASLNGYIGAVRLLLDSKASPAQRQNSYGPTALYMAIRSDSRSKTRIKMIELLLARSNLKDIDCLISCHNASGFLKTALMVAAEDGDKVVCDLLLKAGADPLLTERAAFFLFTSALQKAMIIPEHYKDKARAAYVKDRIELTHFILDSLPKWRKLTGEAGALGAFCQAIELGDEGITNRMIHMGVLSKSEYEESEIAAHWRKEILPITIKSNLDNKIVKFILKHGNNFFKKEDLDAAREVARNFSCNDEEQLKLFSVPDDKVSVSHPKFFSLPPSISDSSVAGETRKPEEQPAKNHSKSCMIQ